MAKWKVTPAMVSAAGKGRKFPTLASVNLASDAGVTKNDGGQISSPAMTKRYVESYVRANHLKS